MAKKRIAIIVNGGIGVGFRLEGSPWLADTVDKLAEYYDLTVYSFVKVDKKFQSSKYRIVDVPFNNHQSLTVRFILLAFKLFKNHLCKPYRLFHAFWGFPSGTLAAGLGKLVGVPSIVSFLGGEVVHLPEINYGEFQKAYYRKIMAYTTRNASAIIALTTYQLQKIRESGLPVQRIALIPFGANSSLFKFVEKPLQPPYQFLHLANLNLVKDQATLLKAFQKISQQIEAHLTIAGFDTLNGKIQALAQDLGLSEKVTFLKRISHPDLPKIYADAHIFLLTSLSEGQAVVVNEAIMSGAVAIGTRVGIIADFENDFTLAVSLKDADGLAEKAIDLLKNPRKYADLRANGLEWSTIHHLEWTVTQYQKLYDEVW